MDVFFDYEAPQELVAQHPSAERGGDRLMAVDRASGALTHEAFDHLPDLLKPGDVLVVNDTRVVPSRVLARKLPGGGKVEILFLAWSGPRWRGIVKGSVRPGSLLEARGWPEHLRVVESAGGNVVVEAPAAADPLAFFAAAGVLPLPPYIRREEGTADAEDRERYQTVFARDDGSVAAPTAGLHFTPALMSRLGERGIEVARATLHVGWGTFAPVRGDWREHRLDPEWGRLSPEAAATVNAALASGRRVVGVGTTVVRLLEASWDGASRTVVPGEGPVSLFITPGFTFRVTGAMVTNFHRPRSTLLLLVDALAGSDLMRRAYAEAISSGYRLFSYGDAMLIQ